MKNQFKARKLDRKLFENDTGNIGVPAVKPKPPTVPHSMKLLTKKRAVLNAKYHGGRPCYHGHSSNSIDRINFGSNNNNSNNNNNSTSDSNSNIITNLNFNDSNSKDENNKNENEKNASKSTNK